MPVLDVYFYGKLVGKLSEKNSHLSFKYLSSVGTPISINLPLQDEAFSDKATRSFFNNLLPEEGIKEAVARYKQVSSNNPFALLKEIGGECAGAVELYPEGMRKEEEITTLIPISTSKIAKVLLNQAQVPLLTGEEIRLSLAGAQQKIALCIIPEDSQNYYLPCGDYISTHIIKPQNPFFEDIIYNENFCMRLANRIGLNVAYSDIKEFDGVKGYVVKRFDRKNSALKVSGIERIHQEDFCQALMLTDKKYQKEGGASIKQCYKLIRIENFTKKADALITFLQTIVFNFIIGNSDAHGKNFSLLHKNGKYELSPLYDLVSTGVYEKLSLNMAMSIDGEYNPNKITKQHFLNLAKELEIKPNMMEEIINTLADKVLKNIEGLKSELKENGGYSPIIDKIENLINRRIKQLIG